MDMLVHEVEYFKHVIVFPLMIILGVDTNDNDIIGELPKALQAKPNSLHVLDFMSKFLIPIPLHDLHVYSVMALP